MSRLIALAAGTAPEFTPEQIIYAAADAGFNAVGIDCVLSTWTPTRTQAVIKALEETQLIPLDIEVIWFQPNEAITSHDQFVDIAIAVGARNILCVSSEPDINDTRKRFEYICRRVENTPIRVALEFLSITEINSLPLALEVVNDVAHPAGAVLLDTLHCQRRNASISDIEQLDPKLIPYVQLCDGNLLLADNSFDGQIEDAVFLRALPGEGEMPLQAWLNSLPDMTPISMEIRSRKLYEQYPDLTDRAKAVYKNVSTWLNINN